MKTLTKDFLKTIVYLFIAIVVVSCFIPNKTKQKIKEDVFGSNYSQAQYLVGTASTFDYVATTTNPTVTLATGSNIDYVNFLVTPNASSTTAMIKFSVEYSDDNSTYYMGDNASNNEASSTDLSITYHSSVASTTHTWIPGSTDTKGKMITIDNKGAEYLRFTFFQGLSGATAANNYGIRVKSLMVSNDN